MVKNGIVLLDPYSNAWCQLNITLLHFYKLIRIKKMIKNEIVLLDPYSNAQCQLNALKAQHKNV